MVINLTVCGCASARLEVVGVAWNIKTINTLIAASEPSTIENT